ncbi:MAG: DUF5615 family PIN-like protein [Solirubrobacterales bacterium]
MRFLLDEMYPPGAATRLRDHHGHDGVHVNEVGLRATDDAVIAGVARSQDRVMVTENVAHFAAERDLVLVFIPKRKLPVGGGQAADLADLLDRWARNHPEPYLGPHWPA